ncbi:hypothetical protein AX16_003165 [Volvariella volvacea WC 439]|nr:hypothetical protein AX16_003165 [Volvariella volvacea WC 439]
MAPKHSHSLLFHPKKNAKKEHQPPPRRPPGSVPRPPRPAPANDEEELQLPNTEFTDFRLMSSALNGWKYDVMKFDSRKKVDILTWNGPIKLNRKDLRRDEPATTSVPQAVGPMLGPDGKPVIGADGNVVMVDAEGKPIHSSTTPSTPNGSATGGSKAKTPASLNSKKKFQKKTRQVFYVPEEVRQLRREERYPWVMEDSTGQELWVGQMEEASKSETHAFFMPAANDVFKFVPAHRWYKFQKKLKHDLPTDTTNVEQFYSRLQKRDPAQWLAARNGGRGPSAATAAMFKAEAEGRTVALDGSLVHTAGQSLGPGGRRLRAVDSGADRFGDDEEGGPGSRKRETGEDGDLDELLYEEEFADDDDKMEPDPDDEEAKELEERLKREYKIANKQRDGNTIESDEENETPTLSKQAKAMQKLIRNREGNDAYESDEEKNPYASSDEEEEDEELPVITGEPAIIQQPQQVDFKAAQATKAAAAGTRPEANGGRPGLPPTQSPTASPSMGGHSLIAKRATSPKASKPSISRDNSPSRPLSSAGNARPGTPSGVAQQSHGGQKINGMKRKAVDDGSPPPGTPSSGAPSGTLKKKKRTTPEGELDDNMVIEWLRNTPNATTRDCLKHFKSYLVDDATRSNFTRLVKEVAVLKNGVLVLRSAYRGGSSVPSPAATPGA